ERRLPARTISESNATGRIVDVAGEHPPDLSAAGDETTSMLLKMKPFRASVLVIRQDSPQFLDLAGRDVERQEPHMGFAVHERRSQAGNRPTAEKIGHAAILSRGSGSFEKWVIHGVSVQVGASPDKE